MGLFNAIIFQNGLVPLLYFQNGLICTSSFQNGLVPLLNFQNGLICSTIFQNGLPVIYFIKEWFSFLTDETGIVTINAGQIFFICGSILYEIII